VVFIGCVGKDQYADTLRTESERQGVRVEYRIDEEQPTGRCGVVITGSNRSLCTDLAAANCYKIEHLKQPEIWSLVEQAKVFYVGGYHLTVSPPAIMALAEEAASKDKTFILNLSAPFIPQFFKDSLGETSPYWDYLLGNETEAEAWAKSHDLPTTSTVQDIAKALVTLPKKNEKRKRYVVITQGTEPTIVAEQAHDGEVVVNEYPVHVISKDKIYDTNGAG
jgi:adenosine kinase